MSQQSFQTDSPLSNPNELQTGRVPLNTHILEHQKHAVKR